MTYKQFRNTRTFEVEMYLTSRGFGFNKFSSSGRESNLKLKEAPCCGHKDSLSISEKTGLWECWFSPCGKKGNWITFRKMIGDPLLREETDYEIIMNHTEVWESHFGKQNRGPVTRNKYEDVLEYCNSRGISNETLDAFRVTNVWNNGIRVPIYGWNNENWVMVNARCIKVIGDKKNWFDISGGPTHLMMGNHLLDPKAPEKRAMIFEGQWDAMTAYELGLRNVFSLPNGSSHVEVYKMLQYIPSDFEVKICVDMDEAGDICSEKFYAQLGPERFTRLHLPENDLNEWFVKDRSITAQDVLDTAMDLVKKKLEPKKYRSIRRNISAQEKQKPLVETPFVELTKRLGGGFYGGGTTGILAASGSGKTTLVNQIALFSANQNIITGLIGLEGTEEEMDENIDKSINGIADTDSNILNCLKVSELKGKEISHGELVTETARMIGDGCKIVIVDNLDFITSGTDQQKYETMGRLVTLAKNSLTHIILVWQPNKVNPQYEVSSFNQKGESRTFQDHHNYIVMNRRKTGRKLKVEKCRKIGTDPDDSVIYLKYNSNFNIYQETSINNTKMTIVPFG